MTDPEEDAELDATPARDSSGGQPGPENFIDKDDRAPEWDPFGSPQPVWQWQGGKTVCKFFLQGKCTKGDDCNFSHEESDQQWKNFSPEDSVQIDRYYKAYEASGEKFACEVKLSRMEMVLDFKEMKQWMKGHARSIQRTEVEDDWLNNSLFSEVFSATLKRGGMNVDGDPRDLFDFCRNQDFRNVEDDGKVLKRGGRDYRIPCGWKRIAVKSLGKYENNAWLRDGDDGWAVAYHGTSEKGLTGVLSTGFQVGPRQKFEKECGKGIYCTYDLDVAARYTQAIEYKRKSMDVVLQLRVKPESIKEVTTGDCDIENKYWVINDPDDVRAYGVLIRGEDLGGGDDGGGGGGGGGGCCAIL